MKRLILTLITLGLIMPLWAAGSSETISRGVPERPVKIALLNGPSGIGLIEFLSENPLEGTGAAVDTEVLGAPKVLLGQLLKEEWDAAVLPAGMAALIYNKGIGYKAAGITGLGNLYLICRDDITMDSAADLEGKTVYIPGRDTTPDLITRLIASEKNVQVTLDYSFNPSDLAKAMAGGIADIAVLPEPMATIALKTGQNLKIALDMQTLWKETFPGEPDYPLTVLVINSRFADQYPDLVLRLQDAADHSLGWVASHPAEASALIKDYGFTLPPPIVAQAVPRSNYVFIRDGEMEKAMAPYLSRVMSLDPASIGGKIPGPEFYF